MFHRLISTTFYLGMVHVYVYMVYMSSDIVPTCSIHHSVLIPPMALWSKHCAGPSFERTLGYVIPREATPKSFYHCITHILKISQKISKNKTRSRKSKQTYSTHSKTNSKTHTLKKSKKKGKGTNGTTPTYQKKSNSTKKKEKNQTQTQTKTQQNTSWT